ncbi:MAG: hypothetical protein AVDCRST_MAG44-1074 [uncultured Sphingomonas sp.]|uniref:Uncharacterized protein n=1 Tax=uncultured Sphingomonas sp. TaxID=158754 RepID=A0A6J4SV75_9SPHN|nr:MAG: hypothetical protein AVDCRST_MAG44-1074 [uncultured Sphingomonas sp.]
MGAGYFVIAILGCGDGSAACTPVATVPTHYATEQQCNAATSDALTRNNDFDFPTIVARCRSVATPVSSSAGRDDKPDVLALRG